MKQTALLSYFIAALVLVTVLPAGAQDFRGYPCTVDCSGHEAGYNWAERTGIDSSFDCRGNSKSFNEGCEAYVEEQEQNREEEQRQEAEDDGGPADE